MIASLRKQVEDHVGHGIDAAALTWARDQAVYEEDMLDAMEYVRLESRAYGAKGNMLPWQKECEYASILQHVTCIHQTYLRKGRAQSQSTTSI